MGQRIRLVVADDLTLIRQGIGALLTRTDEVEVIGEASTADEAVRLALELKPDALLMDQDIPGDGVDAIRQIKQRLPDLEIIVMAHRLENGKAYRAVEAGAAGYVVKDIPVLNLLGALRSVVEGRSYFHPQNARRLVERLGLLSSDRGARLGMEVAELTARELDVLIELARGSTDREIAAKFVVAEGTVKTHIRHILRKLGARNRTEAVAHVLRKGIID